MLLPLKNGSEFSVKQSIAYRWPQCLVFFIPDTTQFIQFVQSTVNDVPYVNLCAMINHTIIEPYECAGQRLITI